MFARSAAVIRAPNGRRMMYSLVRYTGKKTMRGTQRATSPAVVGVGAPPYAGRERFGDGGAPRGALGGGTGGPVGGGTGGAASEVGGGGGGSSARATGAEVAAATRSRLVAIHGTGFMSATAP